MGNVCNEKRRRTSHIDDIVANDVIQKCQTKPNLSILTMMKLSKLKYLIQLYKLVKNPREFIKYEFEWIINGAGNGIFYSNELNVMFHFLSLGHYNFMNQKCMIISPILRVHDRDLNYKNSDLI